MNIRISKKLLSKHFIERKGKKYRYTHPEFILCEGDIWESIYSTGWTKNFKKVMNKRRYFILKDIQNLKYIKKLLKRLIKLKCR